MADPKDPKVLKFLDAPKPTVPIHKRLRYNQSKLWQTPASGPACSHKLESKYQVQRAPGFRRMQLPYKSIVVSYALKRVKSNRTHTNNPPGQDQKLLDNVGKKVFQRAMLSAELQRVNFNKSCSKMS